MDSAYLSDILLIIIYKNKYFKTVFKRSLFPHSIKECKDTVLHGQSL